MQLSLSLRLLLHCKGEVPMEVVPFVQADPAAQSAPIPMNGASQPMYQVPGLSEPGAAMSMPLQVGLPGAVADNYQVTA